ALVNINCPVFVAHSPDDDIIPFRHGQLLYEAAGEPRAFLQMAGGHNEGFIFMLPAWVGALGAFLETHVARTS
ncbi:MAG: alpha/beta hydrolase, partial [Gammaproteobacteria bacterium]|nr:alpha/beta hydrolase [Gammaproteobacteria bacterium]